LKQVIKPMTIDIIKPQSVIQKHYIQHNFQMIEYCQLISPHDPEHPDYNRGVTGINRKIVDKIKSDFNPNRVDPVTVSVRDGKYYIIDGQHTSVAIYELNDCDPHCLIQCKVLNDLTHEEEAKMFVDMNVDIQTLKLPDKIWALIISGDEHAKGFKAIINNSGYDFEIKGPKQISAVSACWSAYEDNDERFAEILSVTSQAWPDNGKALSNMMTSALRIFMEHHEDEYERDWLIKKLSETNHKEIEKVGKVDNGNSRDKANESKNWCAYREVVRLYNYNRIAKKKLRLWMPAIDG